MAAALGAFIVLGPEARASQEPRELQPGLADPDPSPTVRAPAVEGQPPTLDGRLAEAAWFGAGVATDFVQSEPSPGEPARLRTEVLVLRSDDALYVGARMYDPDPEAIQAPMARRNEEVHSDWFIVYLDPDGEGRTAVAFAVNPRGVKRDFRLGEDGRIDPGWEAVWDAAASVDQDGWVVELRIPFSQLRPGRGGSQGRPWGVNFQRHVARSGQVSSWTPFPSNPRQVVGSFGALMGMQGARTPLGIEVSPYSMARATAPSGGDHEAPPVFGTVGGDLRVGLPAHLSLTATFNPDFGQVEADPAVVNVSGYRTFFPEKRPFFLEDQQRFEHQVGTTRIFHSRRIGREVQPTGATRSSLQRVPDASGILAASKLTGRTPGGWSTGILHAVTNAEVRVTEDSVGVETLEPLEPRTNYLVARLVRDRDDGEGSVGGLLTMTHRGLDAALADELVSRALAGGVNWYRQAGQGRWELSGSLLGSRVEGAPPVLASLQQAHGRYLGRPDATHLTFDPERRVLHGFAADLHLGWQSDGILHGAVGGHALSPGFEVNDLGYQREADLVHQFAQVGLDHLGEGWLLRRRRLTLTQWAEWTFGRERTATGARAEIQLQTRNFWTLVLQGEGHLPALSPDQLRGGPALAMPGRRRGRAVLVSDPRRPLTLRLDGSLTVEEETDALLGVFRTTVGVRPTGRLLVSLEPSVVERRGEVQFLGRPTAGGEPVYLFGRTDHRTLSLVSRADFALTPTLTLQLYAQPYLVTREIDELMEVDEPRAPSFDRRFRMYPRDRFWLDPEAERIEVDRTGDGSADVSIPDPSFTYGQLSSNLVLRWEFRPGSTFYLVWSRDVRDRASSGSLEPVDGLTDLLGLGRPLPVPATNVLLAKVTFWWSP